MRNKGLERKPKIHRAKENIGKQCRNNAIWGERERESKRDNCT